MWKDLSAKEKGDIIRMAINNGITDLGSIRKGYNKYSEGGPINEEDKKYNTIQEKLYKNITPFGYHDPIKRVYNAVMRDKYDSYRENENTRINQENPESSALDAVWATYLNIPLSKRRHINPNYDITKTPQGYYRFNDPNLILDFDRELDYHGIYNRDNRQAIFMNSILGNYTVGLDRDKKGDYIYYSDSRLNNNGTPNIKTGWDLNPFSKTTDSDTTESIEEVGQYGQNKKSLLYKTGKFLLGDKEDLSFGIGTPVPIYDKIYLDDYYKIPDEHRGAYYMPQLVVTPENKNSYGNGGFVDGTYEIPEYESEYQKRRKTESVVDSYIDNVLWTMENPSHTGFNYVEGKYYPYADSASQYNLGPGLNKYGKSGKVLDFSGNKGYTKEELNQAARGELLSNMENIMIDLYDMYGENADNMSLGNKMILLDIAHNVRPHKNKRKNMPKAWPSLLDGMMSGNIEKAKKNTYSGSTRRQKMRNDLLNKDIVDINTVKNR